MATLGYQNGREIMGPPRPVVFVLDRDCTGYSTVRRTDMRYDDMAGCIDAPDWMPTGSTIGREFDRNRAVLSGEDVRPYW
jgi:hypothetical protein